MILVFWLELENLLLKKKVIFLYKGMSVEFIICYKWLMFLNIKYVSSGVWVCVVEFFLINCMWME